jgi:hypothetical protein
MPVQQLISQIGAFTTATKDAIQANFNVLFGGLLQVGNVYFCQPNTTVAVANQDGSQAKPDNTLLAAYNRCVTGRNDVVVLVGNGGTGATARVDAAFTWSKDATHLVGICSPVLLSQRARIAPTSGVTAFTPYFTISGAGCAFVNVQWFMGFTTGTTSQLGMVITSNRCYFKNCHIAGMADNESAQSAGSRSLKISGGGEHLFEDCTIGIDTITRTAANASVEFASGTPRNVFRRCIFPFMTSSATVLGILGTGNGCVDRFNLFDQCLFVNAIKSTSTAMTVLGSFTTASPGGMILFKGSAIIGMTDFGDTNFFANTYVDMAEPSGTAGGIMVVTS